MLQNPKRRDVVLDLLKTGKHGLAIVGEGLIAQVQNAAVAAAEKYLALANTRYTGGVTSYLEVTTAQSAALSDEVTAVNILGRRMVDAVTLVQALGGGWNSSSLPAPNAVAS